MSKSKFGLVFMNSRGTKSKIQTVEYEPSDTVTPGGSLSLIGQIYDHTARDNKSNEPYIGGYYPQFLVTDDAYSDLYGKLMTLVDATIFEPAQRKAFKDMVGVQLLAWSQKHREQVQQVYEGVGKRSKSAEAITYSEQRDDLENGQYYASGTSNRSIIE